MKLLAVLFLVGFALASAIPAPSHELSLDDADDLDLLLDFALEAEGDDEIKTKLQEKFYELLQKVKDAIDKGKVVKEDIIAKLKETRNKMKDMKVDLGEKAKALLERIKEKAKDFWQRILDKLTPQESDRLPILPFIDKVIIKNLKKTIHSLLETIKESVEDGLVEEIPDRTFKKIRTAIEALKEFGYDMSDTIEDFLKRILKDVPEKLEYILGKLGIEKKERAIAFAEKEGDDEIKTELGRKLQEEMNRILEKFKDAIEKGKEVREDLILKFKETREKLKDLKLDLGNKAKDLLEKIKDKAKDYWKKILDRLTPEDSDRLAERSIFEKLKKKLNEACEKLMKDMKTAMDNGKEISDAMLKEMKDVMRELKSFGVDVSETVQEFLKKTVENNELLKTLLDKLGLKQRAIAFAEEDDDVKTELGKKLRDQLDQLLKKVKDAVDGGRVVKDDIFEKLKEIRKQMKDLKVNIGNKARELIEKIKENGKDYWQKILDMLRPESRRSVHEFAEGEDEEPKTELGKKLKKHLEELLEKIKEAIDHGKIVKDEHMDKVNQIRDKLKELHEHIGTKAKELFEKIKEEGKNYWKKILEKLGLEKRALEADDDSNDVAILREKIGVFLKKVKEAIENDEKLNVEEISRQIVEQYRKLKNKGIELSEKDSDLIRLMGQKIKEYFQKQLEKIGKQERSISGFREKLTKLREKIVERFDVDAIKARIEEIFGQDSEFGEFLKKLVDKKGDNVKEKLLNFIDKILGNHKGKRSIKDVYDKVKEYLKNMKIELKEKFSKFGEWAVDQYKMGLEKGKNRAESLKKLANEFINKAKHMSRDVIDEAKEFFKEYKDDLGIVYDHVVTEINEIVKS